MLTDALAESLFDALPDVVFFIKDSAGRYLQVNQTLVRRSGRKHKDELIGRTSSELFRPPFGALWLAQDRTVLDGGGDIVDQLELHLYPDRDPGWCLTRKLAIHEDGAIVGLCGISRDLAMADKKNPAYRKVAACARLIAEQYDRTLSMRELAGVAGMSVAQLERYFLRIYALTPRQMIIKTRLDAAARLLGGSDGIAHIALACGYADHSAFSRQFKASTGVTPAQFRLARVSPT